MTHREIDAAVAVALGIMARYRFAPGDLRHAERASWFDFTDITQRRPKWAEPTRIVRCGDDVPLYDDGLDKVPRYSTDIAAAWQVVEKMRAEWSFSLHDVTGHFFAASFERREQPHDRGIAGEPSAPLAICRAALSAYGINVETADPSPAAGATRGA